MRPYLWDDPAVPPPGLDSLSVSWEKQWHVMEFSGLVTCDCGAAPSLSKNAFWPAARALPGNPLG